MIDRRRFLAGSAAFAAAALPRTSWAAPVSHGTVSVRFNWTMKGEFSPFVVARERGFYRDAGLDVQLNPGTSGTQAATSVATGHDDFGYIPSIQVVEGINREMPIRTIATCGNYTGMCWTARSNVPLIGPKSLEGHKVSISPSSTFFQVWDAFAKKFGVDKSKVDVVGADPSARVGLFLDGRVDIMADIFQANDLIILEQKVKQKLNVFRLAQVDFDPLGYLLVANSGTIKNDPGKVKAFTDATVRGLAYTHDHPDEAAQIIAHAYDNLAPAVYHGQVREFAKLINAKPVPGKSEAAAWSRSLEILRSAGVIDHALDQTQYYTNQFLA